MVTTDFGKSTDISNAVAIQSDGKIIAAGESMFGEGTGFSLVRINTDGTIDNTFGNYGVVGTLLGSSAYSNDDRIQAIAIQPDGKILATGRTYPTDAKVIRYNTDGSIDNTFGTNGIATATGISWAYDIDLQTNGKIVVTGEARNTVTSTTEFGVARLNTDGTSDNSFDNDGLQQTSPGINFYASIASSAAIQPDGKIVVAGYSYNGTITTFVIMRYNSDGSLDTSFDDDGIVNGSVFNDNHEAHAIVLQTDGKIIAGGTFQGTTYDFALVRYNADGSLDSTFSDDAIVTTDVGYDNLSALSIQTDGKILAAGTLGISSSPFSIARYNIDGTPDLTFSDDGIQLISIGTNAIAKAMAIQPDGKIVLSGTEWGYAITRINSDGELDNAFSNDGILVFELELGSDQITDMKIQPDGKIVTLGNSGHLSPVYGYTTDASALCRYNTDGSLDASFGTNGISIPEIGDNPTALALQDDGKILTGIYYSFAIYRLKSDGSIDSTFGTNGSAWVLDFFIGAYNSSVASIIVQPDGKIIAGGYAQEFGFVGDKQFALARFNSDGSIDSTFGIYGKVLTNISLDYDEIRDLALQPDGKIIAAGLANSRFGLVRYNANGSLDNSFGSNGIIITAIGTPWYDIANSVTLQADGKIIAAGRSQVGNNQFFALARYTSAGSLDPTFDTDGKLTADFNCGWNEALSVSVQPDGKIIAAGSAGINDYSNFPAADFALVRFNSDGTTDTNFGNNGKVVTDFSSHNDEVRAMALQSDGAIVVAGFSSNGFDYDFSLARYYPGLEPGIREAAEQEYSIYLYPNPVSDLLLIESDISIGIYYLLDITGKTVLQGSVTSTKFTLDLSTLSSGVYFISVTDGDKQVFGKVVKE